MFVENRCILSKWELVLISLGFFLFLFIRQKGLYLLEFKNSNANESLLSSIFNNLIIFFWKLWRITIKPNRCRQNTYIHKCTMVEVWISKYLKSINESRKREISSTATGNDHFAKSFAVKLASKFKIILNYAQCFSIKQCSMLWPRRMKRTKKVSTFNHSWRWHIFYPLYYTKSPKNFI